MNNLSPENQARLDKFRSKAIDQPNKLPQPKPKQQMPNYVPRRGDYGEELSDFAEKDRKAWSASTINKGPS